MVDAWERRGVWRERLAGTAVAAPTYRRLRRELQWHRDAVRRLATAPEGDYSVAVAEHRTPLFRPLSGLDQQLQLNKVTNLRLAAAHLDGVVLPPGRTLSVWRQVGAPTARRGYLPGLVLHDGHLGQAVGGGLCQLTNLLYWLTLHTPLEVTERWRHTYDLFPDAGRTQPFASGATCSYPSLDLQIRNPTAAPYRLSLTVTRTELVGAWRATLAPACRYEVYEDAHLITHEGPGRWVRRNRLARRSYAADGSLVGDEVVAENHALMMYHPFLPAGPCEHPVAEGRLPAASGSTQIRAATPPRTRSSAAPATGGTDR